MGSQTFLTRAASAIGSAISGGRNGSDDAHPPETFEVTRTPEEWRALLTPEQYSVLREEHTERAGSSPLDKEQREGTFVCAACDLPVFSSRDKFDSGTGWPSFTAPIADGVRTREDRGFLGTRVEVHCRRCGGHFGHVFDDGPPPTGLRYCMNGVALKFVLDAAAEASAP